MSAPKKIYLVLNGDDEYEYWEQFDSLADAVSGGCKTQEVDDDGDEIGKEYVEVFEAVPKRLGNYVQKNSVKKLKG